MDYIINQLVEQSTQMKINKLLKLTAFTTAIASSSVILMTLIQGYINGGMITIDVNKFGENLFEIILYSFLTLGTIGYFLNDVKT